MHTRVSNLQTIFAVVLTLFTFGAGTSHASVALSGVITCSGSYSFSGGCTITCSNGTTTTSFVSEYGGIKSKFGCDTRATDIESNHNKRVRVPKPVKAPASP